MGESYEGTMNAYDESDILAAGASWLWSLVNKPEKEIIILLQVKPDLVKQRISLTCLGQLKVNENPECECSRQLETLQGREGQTTEDLLAELYISLILGVCPHVLPILQNYDGTQIPSEFTAKPEVEDNVYETITRLFKKHKHSTGIDVNPSPAQKDECSVRSYMLKALIPYSCTASITAIHVATALGKHKILKEILSDRLTPVGSLCFHFETGYHSISPFHTAVLHRKYKVIDFLRKKFPSMAGNMDRHFGRGNITPSTLAAQMNDVTALEHLLEGKHYCRSMDSKALLVSLENRSMDCVEFLVKKNHVRLDSSVLAMSRDVSYIFNLHKSDPTLKLIKDLITQPSERAFLKLIVDYQCFPVLSIVSLCIYFDAADTLKYLLESTKAHSVTRFPTFMNLVIVATLKNSPSLLNILMRYVKTQHTVHYTVCSPLYWAKKLHFDACVNILEKPLNSIQRQKERNDIDFKTIPPFPAVLLETRAIDMDLFGILRQLKELGYDINAAITTGSTCLNVATDQRDPSTTVQKNGTLVSLLLELGADVFATKMYQTRGQVMYPSLLLRMLWANVDFSGTAELQRCRPQIIMPLVNSEMQLLILRTVHTLCKGDVEFLRTKLKEMTDSMEDDGSRKMCQDLKEHLDEYIDNPQPLTRLCRNFIRRTNGIHIHNFLKGQTLPKRLVNMLTLKDDLEPYWQCCQEYGFWKYGYDHYV